MPDGRNQPPENCLPPWQHTVLHYLPVILVSLLIMIEMAINLLRANLTTTTPFNISEWPAKIIYAQFAFWIWAIVTNASMGRLARGGGLRNGKQHQRKVEAASIVIFSLLTGLLYILSFGHAVPMPFAWLPTVLAVFLPFCILGRAA